MMSKKMNRFLNRSKNEKEIERREWLQIVHTRTYHTMQKECATIVTIFMGAKFLQPNANTLTGICIAKVFVKIAISILTIIWRDRNRETD